MSGKNKEFAVFLLTFLIGLVVLYGTTVDYSYTAGAFPYDRFADVQVMTFIGLSFLLTFVVRNGLTAAGHSLLIATFVVLWYILTSGFFASAIPGIPDRVDWKVIKINVDTLVNCDFAATAVLIAFGAVFGRLSSAQLLVMGLFQTVFYSFNEAVIKSRIKPSDVGAGFHVHCFAPIFGLAVSIVATRSKGPRALDTTIGSEVTSMIGTLFLWCYYPSWNSVHAEHPLAGQYAVVNTILSICAGTVVAFMVEMIIHDDQVKLFSFQRSAIAGGIAMAASANFNQEPFASLIIGAVAGFASTMSFHYLQPPLMRLLKFNDTNGIFSSHLIPAIVGGLTSVIVTRQSEIETYGDMYNTTFAGRLSENRTAQQQASYQLAAMALSIAFGLFGGLFTGTIVELIPTVDSAHEDYVEYDIADMRRTFRRAGKRLASSSVDA